jgi:hypothetical protein
MSVGKFTSLEEVRKDPKLLKQFIRERVAAGQGEGDETRMVAALGSMLKSSPAAGKTSPKANDEGYSGTRIPPDISPDVSAKPKRGSHE